VSDFWAPELHRVAGEWLVCFSARTPRRDLAIGLARAASPDGPFVADPEPLIGGGVIDPHILVDAEDRAWLIWKRDDNGRWPPALMNLLADQPWLGPALFAPADARMAAALLALWPWASSLEPMQQFFLLQPLIEAVSDDLDGFGERLRGLLPGLARSALGFAGAILAALRTPIFAQPLSKDGRSLEGEPTVILQNDAPWEGHLVEGVWVSRQGERYYLLYAGNDFSTSKYAIGVAVAERPCGPYRKASDALLQSTARWQGPGHPSVVRAPDGELRMFLHAFPPGEAGYKAFRALLSTPIRLADGVVSAGDPPDGGPPPEP
jgi:hypothetical protein